jgi:hypothetical protein
MPKDNQLSYYSAKLLKDVLVELGYTEVKEIKRKKDLIEYITILIQSADEDTYITDSDEDSDSDEIITIDMTHVLQKLRNI